MRKRAFLSLCATVVAVAGCSGKSSTEQAHPAPAQPAVNYFKVDPQSAGSITGTVHFRGKRIAPKPIDISEDPVCVKAHPGKAFDESLVVSGSGGVSNAFLYISHGLEGKVFETPSKPVVIDQRGCSFQPRIVGIQTGEPLEVINSDPVTHNIHPMAATNREWNHSQGPGDPPITRKFTKPEIMIPVKCNIHSWMRAFIGVLDHPYFDVSKPDGSFALRNLPAGTYTVALWQEKLGTQEQQVTVTPGKDLTIDFNLKEK